MRERQTYVLAICVQVAVIDVDRYSAFGLIIHGIQGFLIPSSCFINFPGGLF